MLGDWHGENKKIINKDVIIINDLYDGGDTRNSTCLFETKEDAEGILALIQLTRLHDEWVGDWQPNLDKSSQILAGYSVAYKGYMGFGIINNFYIHSLLCFPTQEMAQEFLDCFKDLIEKAKRFI